MGKRILLLCSLIVFLLQPVLAQKKLLPVKKLSKKKIFKKLDVAYSKSNRVYSLYLLDEELTPSDFEKIKSLDNLQSLTFMFCTFADKPSFIGELTSLQSLSINYCGLKELPPEIGKDSNLLSLDLSGNELTSLPVEMGCLKKLVSLNLFLNKLEDLPVQMDSLDSLKLLNISKNQLYRLPGVISKFNNLLKLDLSYNPIYALQTDVLTVSEEFDKLKACTKLRKLILFSNNVIPVSFKNMIIKKLPLGSLVMFK
jgi:leucine-rich repeat protein SHOC2